MCKLLARFDPGRLRAIQTADVAGIGGRLNRHQCQTNTISQVDLYSSIIRRTANMNTHEGCRLPTRVQTVCTFTSCRHFVTSGMLIATAQPTINKVHEPAPELHTSFRPRCVARNRQPAQTGLCYYHAAFGSAARNCCAPCAWVPSSNQSRIPGNAHASDRL